MGWGIMAEGRKPSEGDSSGNWGCSCCCQGKSSEFPQGWSHVTSPLLPRAQTPPQEPMCIHRQRQAWGCSLFLWLTIDRLYPRAHLQSAYQASSSTLLWQHPLDQGYWTSLALSAFSSKPEECSSLGLLLCQPVELFSFSFPTSTTRAWLPQLPLSLLGSCFFPVPPTLVVAA